MLLVLITAATKKASDTGCQRPVRDNSIDMTIIGFTVGGFALLTFGIRLVTRLTTNMQQLYMDDWLMLAAVVRWIRNSLLIGGLLFTACDRTSDYLRALLDSQWSRWVHFRN